MGFRIHVHVYAIYAQGHDFINFSCDKKYIPYLYHYMYGSELRTYLIFFFGGVCYNESVIITNLICHKEFQNPLYNGLNLFIINLKKSL